jgi:hypothetical protein
MYFLGEKAVPTHLLPHPYALRLYAGPLLLQAATTPGGKKVQLLSLPYFLAGQV